MRDSPRKRLFHQRQRLGYEILYALSAFAHPLFGHEAVIEIRVEPFGGGEAGYEARVPQLVREPFDRDFQVSVFGMSPLARLGDGDHRMRRRAPQFFGRLQDIPRRELARGFRQEMARRFDMFLNVHPRLDPLQHFQQLLHILQALEYLIQRHGVYVVVFVEVVGGVEQKPEFAVARLLH